MSDTDTILQLIDNLSSFGILALVVVAFMRGWVVPTPLQTKIDLMRVDFDANRVAKDTLHEEEVKQLQLQYSSLHDTYHKEVVQLYEKQIATLEQLLKEREARVEQGIQMIAGYTKAQDSLSTLADLIKDKP